MNQQFLDTVLKFVEVGSATVKKAMDENEVHRVSQKRAADLRGALLDHMVASGVIADHQKQAAEAMLASHAESLQLLKAATDKIVDLRKQLATKQAGDIGQGQSEKKAGLSGLGVSTPVPNGNGQYDSLSDPFVGRKTSEKKASDLALMKVLESPPGR